MARIHDPLSYATHGRLSTATEVAGLVIASVEPSQVSVDGGETVRISVRNAGDESNSGTVVAGGTSWTVVSWSATLIVATTAAKAAGTYDLVVTGADASTDTLPNGVTYYSPGGATTFVVEADADPEVDAYA